MVMGVAIGKEDMVEEEVVEEATVVEVVAVALVEVGLTTTMDTEGAVAAVLLLDSIMIMKSFWLALGQRLS